MSQSGTFHWLRAQVFVYATEDEDLVHDSFVYLVGNDEVDVDISDGEHGNHTFILQERMEKQRQFNALFSRLPQETIDEIIADADNRVDEDCCFYIRLNKQRFVQGYYELAHNGDVVAITGKLVSHPARKEIAVNNLVTYLKGIVPSGELPPQRSERISPL